jgi:hypothetical protein
VTAQTSTQPDLITLDDGCLRRAAILAEAAVTTPSHPAAIRYLGAALLEVIDALRGAGGPPAASGPGPGAQR